MQCEKCETIKMRLADSEARVRYLESALADIALELIVTTTEVTEFSAPVTEIRTMPKIEHLVKSGHDMQIEDVFDFERENVKKKNVADRMPAAVRKSPPARPALPAERIRPTRKYTKGEGKKVQDNFDAFADEIKNNTKDGKEPVPVVRDFYAVLYYTCKMWDLPLAEFHNTPFSFHGKTVPEVVNDARMIISYVAYSELKMSYAKISKQMGAKAPDTARNYFMRLQKKIDAKDVPARAWVKIVRKNLNKLPENPSKK